jgi:hypothetical protein
VAIGCLNRRGARLPHQAKGASASILCTPALAFLLPAKLSQGFAFGKQQDDVERSDNKPKFVSVQCCPGPSDALIDSGIP